MHVSIRRRAFTLVELLVAVSIIVVLIAILIPALGGARNSARRTATTSLMTSVGTAINQFKSQNNRLPGFFSQAELGRPTNDTGFTSMENALLDLSGGIDPNATLGRPEVIEVEIITGAGPPKRARINTLQVGGGENTFLNLAAKGVAGGDQQAGGLAPARNNYDQKINPLTIPAGDYQMPDILDSWGKPIMLWAKNEAAGPDPDFSQETFNPAEGSLFYWQANKGYLEAAIQDGKSALSRGVPWAQRERTMAALLGHPAFPDPDTIADAPEPLSPRADFVLHSAGQDGVFLTNKGDTNTEYRYLPSGAVQPRPWEAQPSWSTIDKTDDLIQGGG